MRRATVTLLLALALTGCLPAVKVAPTQPATIRLVCPACVTLGVGYAPLDVVLFAERPDNADGYHWQLGDGTRASGRLVSHTYPTVGHYVVTLTATKRINARETKHEAQTALIVLDPPKAPTLTQHFENELLSVSVLAPRALEIGQSSVIEYIVVAKRDLAYIDLRSAPDQHIFAEHDGYFQKILVPSQARLVFSYRIRGFTEGTGYVQLVLKASDGKVGAEIRETTRIAITP